MVEFYKQKDREAEEREKELEVQKKLKALAVKQVLDTQKRTVDSKAIRDELRAKRHTEQQEREWRRKEREEAAKRQKAQQELQSTILKQIEERQNFLIQSAAFEKAMADKVSNIQEDQMEEVRKQEEARQVVRKQCDV